MKNLSFLIPIAIVTSIGCTNQQSAYHYPESRKVDTVDTYFGKQVADPYRWLEDDYSEETMAWVDEQNELTRSVLDSLPVLEELKTRMSEIWKMERGGVPRQIQGKLYYYYNDGTQNQSVLMVEDVKGTESLVFDPNKLSEDGTATLANYKVSEDGRYMALAISESGSDWEYIQVLDLKTGRILADKVEWVKFSDITWRGNGFFYSAYDAPEEGREYSEANEYHQVFYHALGTPQSKDKRIWKDEDFPKRNYGVQLSEDKKWLMLYGSESTSGTSLKIMAYPGGKWEEVVVNFDHDYGYIGQVDNRLYFMTNANAPNMKIVELNPITLQFSDVISEQEHKLKSAVMTQNYLVLSYLENVISQLYIKPLNNLSSEAKKVELPGIGSVKGVSGSQKTNQVYFAFENYYTPRSIYELNAEKGYLTPFFQPNTPFDSDQFETIVLTYPSKDGTEIPMFITRRKGTLKSANTPCFLYGYGGFNIAIEPHYKSDRIPFLEDGGIYVVANIRGGSEFGEHWHQQGIKTNKQNVFDDFIAAAEYLQMEGWTSKNKLAVHGRSNGGLLTGAILTQRPDLFKVAIPKVGVLDMLRYHQFTIGWAWASDYGRSDESEEMFSYLYRYSPLHNVNAVNYPPTLLVTGDHDDRVVPAHTFKFAATLQEKQKGNSPILLRVDKNAGHGAGKPVSKQINEFADQWAFVYHFLGVK